MKPDELESDWLDLQQRSDCSFFMSWGWIGAWLDAVSIDLKPAVIKVWREDELVGMGLFVPGHIQRRMLIRSRAMFLNEYPFDGRNMVIEYNGLLAARGYEQSVYSEVVNYLSRACKAYDEFYFGAIAYDNSFQYLSSSRTDRVACIVTEESTTWSVDLKRIAPNVSGFLSSLSRNRRAQLGRSIRVYESGGPIKVAEATSRDEARLFLDRLGSLHTRRWQSEGKRGVFANPRWLAFHLSLIDRCFDNGEIQLLKVYSDNQEIGYLYNFVWRRHVYVLQTGFMRSPDKRLMPGYITHAYAVAFNKDRGMRTYDLMHGDDLYKRILCNQNARLVWVVLQRQRLKFSIEKLAVGMVRGFRKLVSS